MLNPAEIIPARTMTIPVTLDDFDFPKNDKIKQSAINPAPKFATAMPLSIVCWEVALSALLNTSSPAAIMKDCQKDADNAKYPWSIAFGLCCNLTHVRVSFMPSGWCYEKPEGVASRSVVVFHC